MTGFLIAVLLGLGLGALAGMIPGLHPNMIGVFILAGFLNEFSFATIAVMLVSSQFFEILRSVFLFVPEEGNVLAMHPIFKFVSEGKGLAVLKLSALGLVAALLLGIIASPLLLIAVPPLFMFVKDYAPFFLVMIAFALIAVDNNRLGAVMVFILSGIVGWYGLQNLNQPLLILLTGFFGIPVLFQAKQKMPKQIISYCTGIEKKSIARGLFSAGLSSFLLTFIPAVGPAQASVFTRSIMKKTEEFFIAIGALSGFDIVFSLILLYSVGRARIGVLENLGQYFTFDAQALILTLFIVFFTAIFSYALVLKIGKFFIKFVDKINYRIVSICVILLVSGFAFYFDSFLGLFFLALAAGVGLLANKLKTRMSHCMGSLMIPTMIYYFF